MYRGFLQGGGTRANNEIIMSRRERARPPPHILGVGPCRAPPPIKKNKLGISLLLILFPCLPKKFSPFSYFPFLFTFWLGSGWVSNIFVWAVGGGGVSPLYPHSIYCTKNLGVEKRVKIFGVFDRKFSRKPLISSCVYF